MKIEKLPLGFKLGKCYVSGNELIQKIIITNKILAYIGSVLWISKRNAIYLLKRKN